MSSRYHQVYESWEKDPEAFWAEAAQDLVWTKPWDTVFDASDGVYGRWFVGAECNTAYNCLDRHVFAGRAGQAALIYDSPVTDSQQTYTYGELTDAVATLAAVMKKHGVTKGDRVIVYMPMIPEAVIGMLACARLGAVHSVVFGGFAREELAARIDDCTPKCHLAPPAASSQAGSSTYKPLLDEAIEIWQATSRRPASSTAAAWRPPRSCRAAMSTGRRTRRRTPPAPIACRGRHRPALHPLYSGTTGQPKGVVRDNGGHMVALKWSMDAIYGVEPGEVYLGGLRCRLGRRPLLHRLRAAAARLHRRSCSKASRSARRMRAVLAGDLRAQGVGPVHRADGVPRHQAGRSRRCLHRPIRHDHFRTLFLAGERADPDTVQWAEDMLKVPVIDHWWQTETGWPIAAELMGLGMLPVKLGSPTVPCRAGTCRFSTRRMNRSRQARSGRSACKLPLPPGCLPTLWGNDQRFRDSLSAGVSRLSTRRRMPATWTRTATSTSWPAPTTSSTSRGTACRPARWRKCWPPSRRRRMRGDRCRGPDEGPGAGSGSLCSNPASTKT